jgi:hypothetical protein
MGGHVSKTLNLQKRRDDEKYAREELLGGEGLQLDYYSLRWILNHIDCFVSQSRGNVSLFVSGCVQKVYLCPDVGCVIQL